MDDKLVTAINRAREFEVQDMEYAADLLNDLDDDYPDNQTIVAQWLRKVRTETILAVSNGELEDAVRQIRRAVEAPTSNERALGEVHDLTTRALRCG